MPALAPLQAPCWRREVLQDIVTEALQAPWTPRQRAILTSEEGAESVIEAVARVDRLSEVPLKPIAVCSS